MKRSVIIGNWKMYAESVADAHVIATAVRNGVEKLKGIEIILCPPSIWLSEVAKIIGKNNPNISLGAQNVFYEQKGAYTGEISPVMVKEMADYCIIGHSERRQYFGENDFEVNEKLMAALGAGLKPIVCVGEHKKGTAAEETVRQLKAALANIPRKQIKDIIIAFEPIWAISNGTSGENAEPEYVSKVITKLREFVTPETMIIYGGSVQKKNVAGYAQRPEIDGILVGGSSVRAAEFVEICNVWSEKISNIKEAK